LIFNRGDTEAAQSTLRENESQMLADVSDNADDFLDDFTDLGAVV
jgi:hypothetical protein